MTRTRQAPVQALPTDGIIVRAWLDAPAHRDEVLRPHEEFGPLVAFGVGGTATECTGRRTWPWTIRTGPGPASARCRPEPTVSPRSTSVCGSDRTTPTTRIAADRADRVPTAQEEQP